MSLKHSSLVRRFIVGGNWKCNGSAVYITNLVKELNESHLPATIEVWCAPPFVYLERVRANLNSRFTVAAQNCWVSSGGAFTGEVSAEMLADACINWVILGHSERRRLCGESDILVAEKVAYALSQGLSAVVCIGETLSEHESGSSFQVCKSQLHPVVQRVSPKDWDKIVIAYEPVWAVGTGKVATPEFAQKMHESIRAYIGSVVSHAVASRLRIQYGGSVNPGNCASLARQEDIDGFLVGGASLRSHDFIAICCASAEETATNVEGSNGSSISLPPSTTFRETTGDEL